MVIVDMKKPAKDEWGSALDGMKDALELECTVNRSLLDLHKISDACGDFQVCFVVFLFFLLCSVVF